MQFGGQVTFDDLTVVQVHLYFQVGLVHVDQHLMRHILPQEVVAGHVARIDRFNQDLHVMPGRRLGRPAQIADVSVVDLLQCTRLGQSAGHHMNARTRQYVGIAQRLQHTLAKVSFAARNTRQPTFARVPVPRRRVEQHLLQAMRLQPCSQLLGRVGIREKILHRLEAILGSGCKAVQKIMLGVEQ